jgi:transposase
MITELTEPQLKAIGLLLEGNTNNDVSKVLDVHYNTISNWKKNEVFMAEMSRQRKEMSKNAQNVFANKAEYAAKRIVAMIDDKETTRIQFAAAVKVFESASQTSIEDFEKRIEELETAITREV